jgi:hypothetical protein
MTSPPISRFRFLDADGALTSGPREWRRSLIEIAIPADLAPEARLLRNGESLHLFADPVDGELRVRAEWPLSGAGRYRLRLDLEDYSEDVEATVAPEKISEVAYGRLVDELQTTLPASIAIGLQQMGALTGLQLRPPGETTLAQELHRLGRAVGGTAVRPGLASALEQIARDPHRLLHKTEEWVKRDRVRRLEPVGLIAAIQRTENIDPEFRLPIQVPDVRVEHTVDVYENRLVRTYHDQVALRLRRLAAALEAENLLTQLAEAEGLLARLKRARREASFLDEVSQSHYLPTRTTMVLLKRPAYRALLESYLEFRRSAFVQFEQPGLEAPLESLPDLYEAWGTLRLINVLLEVGEALGYRVRSQQLARNIDGGLYIKVLAGGRPAVVLIHEQSDTVVTLTPQRWFGVSTRPIRSISFRQIPDITVEIASANRPARLLLFDPKYKLDSEDGAEPGDGKPKKIDIDTMHAYRDAIRNDREERLIEYAAILYPGPETRYGDGIEALCANPTQTDPLDLRLRGVLTDALATFADPEGDAILATA